MTTLSTRRENALVGLLTLTAFVFITFRLQLSPLLTAIADEFDQSESRVGQLQTISAIVATVTAVLLAPWMPRLSQRTWFRILLCLLLIGGMLTATAQSFPMLIVAFFVSGMGASVLLACCFTSASEIISDAHRRDRSISLIACGTTVAIMLGLPLVAQIEEHANWRWASAAATLPLLFILFGTYWLPSHRDNLTTSGEAVRRAGYRMVLQDRPTAALLLASILMFLSYIGWLVYFGAYVEHEFDRGAGTLAALFLVGGFAELVAILLLPRLARHVSPWWISIAGAIGGGLVLLGSGVVFSTVTSLFVAIALFHILTAYGYIGANMLLIRSPQEWRGTAMALQSACAGFGGAVGALLGGLVLDLSDSYDTTYHVLGLVLFACAAVTVVGKRYANEAAQPHVVQSIAPASADSRSSRGIG